MVCPVCKGSATMTEVYERADKDTDQKLCRAHTLELLELMKQRREGIDKDYLKWLHGEGEYANET